ncbi:DUF2254 domain-containing protein [Pseudoroseicyclus tamaricis]|uniref:DUF2254 domain-containing protein n=1 Tax=Pseudoroseicyclus tamaricis TaxID=2705421 RepID=A0A6B2JJV1_9RHOB|nr:DUF2254 domain-containing protein [Pseudoroseicyclus tamaricis]NDV01731.1 DUF2254 domain-containing protein [Pseudoroseicyclus tamaricis]
MASIIGISESLVRRAVALWRTLVVRVILFGALALVSIGLTQVISPLLPDEWRAYVGGGAADRLLDIIANAMLAATIFSLTVMVSVYSFSASQWTPRVHRLIVQDPRMQNTIATFIGAFVYSLVAIILREMRVYSDEHALVLFILTTMVLVLVVLALIRWVLHLQGFGQLDQTVRQVEEITARELAKRLETPCLGGARWEGEVPEGATPIRARGAGYVLQIYQDGLNDIAEAHDCHIYMPLPPGTFAHLGEPIAYLGRPLDEELEGKVREQIVTGDARGYVQDPRLGLTVLAEIGSKALSPGINDSGTAIDVITRIGRILSDYRREEAEDGPLYPRLHIPPLDPEDLVNDGFDGIARDGADKLEVQLRVQDLLTGLMAHSDEAMAVAARRVAIREYCRAMQSMTFEPDRARLRAVANAEVLRGAEETGDDAVKDATAEADVRE